MTPEVLIFAVGLLIVTVELAIQIFSVLVIVPIFERRLPFEVAPSECDADAELLSIPTADGLTLRGSLYLPDEGDPLGLVIFCPEFRGNHWTAMEYCSAVRDAGFAVLSFDFRGQGESDVMAGYEPLHWLTQFEVRDLESVIAFARARPELSRLPLGLMGVSRGASAALAVAARDDQIQCVVADSAFTTDTLMVLYAARWVRYYAPRWFRLPEWHLRISCCLARYVSQMRRQVSHPNLERMLPRLRDRHVLLIAGQRDTYVPSEISRRIQQQIQGECGAWFVPKAKHNSARRTLPQEYDARVVAQFMSMAHVHRRAAHLATVDSATPAQLQLAD